MASKPLSGDDSLLLSHQSLPTPSSSPTAPPLGRDPCVTIPFQALVYDITGTETKTFSITIASLEVVKNLIRLFRDAELTQLDAVVYPSAPSLKIPVTVDLAWTTADLTVEASKFMATPGSARVTIGGMCTETLPTLPAQLGFMNPVVKSPIPYTNHPRLNLSFHQSPDAVAEGVRATTKASVVVRGSLRLSNPVLSS